MTPTEPVLCTGGFWETTPSVLSEPRCSVCKKPAVLHPHRHAKIEKLPQSAAEALEEAARIAEAHIAENKRQSELIASIAHEIRALAAPKHSEAPTPRTDEAAFYVFAREAPEDKVEQTEVVMADDARQLERELSAALERERQLQVKYAAECDASMMAGSQLSALRSQLRDANERIKGLLGFKQSVDEALNSGDGSYRP